MPGRLGQRADASGGAHDERLREPRLATARRQRAEVRREHGAEVRVDRRRGGPLVLPELGSDLVGGDDVGRRQAPPHLLRDESLVRRVAKGEQEADRHSLGVERGQRAEVERLDDSLRADALVDADAAVERDERRGMLLAQPVEVGPRLAAEVEDVLEAGRADEGGLRALPFQESVGRDRRPVREPLQREVARADGRGRLDDRVLLRADGRDLGGAQPAVGEEDGVRERPSYVDAEDRHDARLPRRPDAVRDPL